MPLWSIADWRARIGSSWCVIGRPLHKRKMPRRQSKGKSQFLRVLCGCITSLLMVALATLMLYTGPGPAEMSDCKIIIVLSELHSYVHQERIIIMKRREREGARSAHMTD